MQVQATRIDGIQVISVQGEIDGKTAPQAQEAIVPLMPAGEALVLDMGGVGFMSSAGLRMMLLLYRQGASKGCTMALAGLSEEIRDTMDATGFLNFFVVASDVPAAVALLQAS
jgi:anti-sigma B factor antagonist